MILSDNIIVKRELESLKNNNFISIIVFSLLLILEM